MRNHLSISGGFLDTPQAPGPTPHSASRRASGTTQPQGPLRCPGAEDRLPEASEAPAERPRGRQTKEFNRLVLSFLEGDGQ
jgi:hypothetical protein